MIINKFVSLFKTKAFKIALLVALFLTSVLIALAMLLGREAGTFVIRVQDGDLKKSIAVSVGDPNDESSYTSKLSAPGVSGFTDYSPEYFLQSEYEELNRIQKEHVVLYKISDDNLTGNVTGTSSENSNSSCCLYVYTFYIVNTSSEGAGAVGVNVSMNYNKVTKGLDNCIRIMTYAKDYYTSDPKIYQKADSQDVQYDKYIITPTSFASTEESSGVVFDNQKYNIDVTKGNNYMEYSIFFWIEGNDPDESEEVFGSTINFTVNISVEM